MRVKAGVEHTE